MRQESTMVIATWRSVPRTIREWVHDARRFRRIATDCNAQPNSAGVRAGRALWGTWASNGWPIGICWEWAELRSGIVTLANPLHVKSNVALLSNDGERLDDARVLLELNNAVHAMNWQREVCAQLMRPAALALA